jgi:hypothetical protein
VRSTRCRGKSVGVHGADTIQQCLNAGLLDEIHVDIAAVLLGSRVRLFDRLAGRNGVEYSVLILACLVVVALTDSISLKPRPVDSR